MDSFFPPNRFLSESVAAVLSLQEFEAYFQWILEDAVPRYPPIFEEAWEEGELRSTALHTALLVWGSVPLPWAGFRCRPLPRPARNRPCPCGSGKKYKRCCIRGSLPPWIPEELPRDRVWDWVVSCLREDALPDLAGAGVLSVDRLTGLARDELGQGTPRRAVRLLEPLFEDVAELGWRHLEALSTLVKGYRWLRWMGKLRDLVGRVAVGSEPPLNAKAWGYVAAEAADREDWDAAWDAAGRARQILPDSADLASIEVTFLLQQGRHGEAADRARSLLEEHRRGTRVLLDPDNVVRLERAVAAPEHALEEDRPPGLDDRRVERLRNAVEAVADRPVSAYGYDLVEEHGLPVLWLPPELAELQGAWVKVWPLSGEPEFGPLDLLEEKDAWDPRFADAWLGFLEQQPAAFDSLTVLDDLLRAVHSLDIDCRKDLRRFAAPLLRRVEAIVEASLPPLDAPLEVASLPGPDGAGLLPAGPPDNERVLDLLLDMAALYGGEGRDEEADLVLLRLLHLEPQDPPGVRGLLVRRWQRAGRDEEALELMDRYGDDDLVATRWGRVLSLYRLGRRGDALVALQEALRERPWVASVLLAGPGEVRPDSRHGFLAGGKAEAQRYVRNMGDVWHSVPGLLEWMGQSRRGLASKVKPRRR